MKIIKNQIILLAVILLSFSSCVKDNIENTNIENFDLLWTILDENYSGFNVRNVDWDAVRETYRPQALQASTEEELFIICNRMVDRELKDGHNTVKDRDGKTYRGDDDTIPIEDIYDIEVVETYLDTGFEKFASGNVPIEEVYNISGQIKNENIGYLRLFQMEAVGEGNIGGWVDKMDEFIETIKDTDALIIDLRLNGGGDTPIGLYLADRFATTEKLVYNIQTKNGPGHDDFDEPSPNYIKPDGNSQYTKPIVVLTDENSASNAEDFTIKVVTQDHVTHMGTTSAGIFSNISLQKYLPNGWSVAFSHELYTYPDGPSPEGVGIIPEIEIINTPADWQSGTDNVLEAAIDFLK